LKRLKGRIKKLFTGANWNLLREMTRAEFRLSDHNSILGVLWSLINPVLTLAVMYFIFRDRFGKTIHTYQLYLLIGISCVNFFIAATASLVKVFPDNRGFILNTTAPREIVILAKLFIHTYKFIIELALCLALSLYCGVFSSAGLLAALPLLLSYIALVLSFGLILSVSYCFVSDIGHIWGRFFIHWTIFLSSSAGSYIGATR
jgi:ABC-type polysaccharide/polyol phosphate export permease